MNGTFKQRMWIGLGTALIVFCTPLGCYTLYQAMKMERTLRIGDLVEFEERKRKIKTCWIITLGVYALAMVLGALGVFD